MIATLLLIVFGSWLLADFITGLVHWIEDRYLGRTYQCRWVEQIARDNDLHHAKPTAMLVHSQWENMRSGAIVAWPISLLLLILGVPVPIWLSIALSALGNLVHRWAHTPVSQLPLWIRVLQRTGFFLSRAHHEAHHRLMDALIEKQNAAGKYCTLTSWLNPVLDRLNIWSRAESILTRVGIHPTPRTPV